MKQFGLEDCLESLFRRSPYVRARLLVVSGPPHGRILWTENHTLQVVGLTDGFFYVLSVYFYAFGSLLFMLYAFTG